MPSSLSPPQETQVFTTPGVRASESNEAIFRAAASSSRPSNSPYLQVNGLDDPRPSSKQSLRPDIQDGRRTLLLVYIHGFLGSEVSFKSFPAHVHSLLRILVAESHVVHTKIYPTYRSRHDVSVARDAFSKWLTPHESSTTDVVLLGHSLGGIVGAEVVLMPSTDDNQPQQFRHRVLGLVAYDTPFLGMHPGVIGTVISNLFHSTGASPESMPQSSTSTPDEYFDSSLEDPNYNPAFANDVKLPIRKDKWDQARYFWKKHSDNVSKAVRSYVKSHWEFGACLADYPGLKARYKRLQMLEAVDELQRPVGNSGKVEHRVRFLNYYTASTGRAKPAPGSEHKEETVQNVSKPVIMVSEPPHQRPVSSEDMVGREEHGTSEHTREQVIHPEPSTDELSVRQPASTSEVVPDLVSIPPPRPPSPLDPNMFPDARQLKLAQKHHAREVKVYQKAKKEHEKQQAKQAKLAHKKALKEEKAARDVETRSRARPIERQPTLNPEALDQPTEGRSGTRKVSTNKKTRRDRRFCTLPAKDAETGIRDPNWIRVYMPGVDSVTAHTSLFMPGETYAKLVGDTAERIQGWVHDSASVSAVLAGT